MSRLPASPSAGSSSPHSSPVAPPNRSSSPSASRRRSTRHAAVEDKTLSLPISLRVRSGDGDAASTAASSSKAESDGGKEDEKEKRKDKEKDKDKDKEKTPAVVVVSVPGAAAGRTLAAVAAAVAKGTGRERGSFAVYAVEKDGSRGDELSSDGDVRALVDGAELEVQCRRLRGTRMLEAAGLLPTYSGWHAAAGSCNADHVRLYLDAGFNVNNVTALSDEGANAAASSWAGWTALHAAVMSASAEVADCLLCNGAEASCSSLTERLPPSKGRFFGRRDKAGGKGKSGVPANRGWTPLHLAAQAGSAELVRVLLRHNAEVGAVVRTRHTLWLGWTPLHLAAHAGAADVVRLLLEARANPNAVNAKGMCEGGGE